MTRNNPRVRLASFSARHTHKSISSVRIARSTTFPEGAFLLESFQFLQQNGHCNPGTAGPLDLCVLSETALWRAQRSAVICLTLP